MSINTPGERLTGPACVPARYGLLSVAEIEDRPDGSWQLGFHHEQESCEDLEVRALRCPPPADPKEVDGSLSFPVSDPFTLIAPFDCSTGGLTLGEAWDHAEARLTQGEARSLERTFWTGADAAGNLVRQTLGGGAANADGAAFDPETQVTHNITPAAGAVSITDGMAMLESWAAENSPCGPVIHAQRGIATYLAERQLVEASGQVMYARGTGSRVAVGGGYLATGPGTITGDGSNDDPFIVTPNVPTAGESWMFITGGIKVVRSPVFFTPDRGDDAAAVERLRNDVTVFAERTYGIELGCGIAAVRVHLKSCCC